MRLNSNVFLQAAEIQFLKDKSVCHTNAGTYSCNNLSLAVYMVAGSSRQEREYKKIYVDHMAPSNLKDSAYVWWPDVEGKHQSEPRILALLLMGEIVKDYNHPKRHNCK